MSVKQIIILDLYKRRNNFCIFEHKSILKWVTLFSP